jgi:5S rRNA maturation endonuclease (ribonuclease M5)
VLWIKHEEHGQTELHFLIPNVDLESGRAFQPYAHNRDLACRDALDNIINSKFDLADPDDPARKNVVNSASDYLKMSNDRKALAIAVDEAISQSAIATINSGGVYDRKAVVADLKSLGFEVSERAKNISIKTGEMKKPMRLKGAFYEQSAKFDSESKSDIEQATEKYHGSREQRLSDNEIEYSRLFEKRIGYVQRRYKESWKRAEKSLMANAVNTALSSDSVIPDVVLFNNSDSRKSKRTLLDSSKNQRFQPSEQAKNSESEKWNVHQTERSEAELPLSGRLQDRVIDCFYKDKKIGEVVDSGDKLTAKGFKTVKATAFNLIKQAKNKGWQSVTTDSKDPKFLREIFTQAKYKGIELSPKNKLQEELFKEFTQDDGIRNIATRAVETARKRAVDFKRGEPSNSEKSANFGQKIGRFDSAVGARKMRRDDELGHFKTEINLVSYAQNQGFEVVKKESTAKSIKMKNSSDTLIISTDKDGHGIYFNATSNKSGSIIDLVQELKSLNLGQVRKELRPWIGRDSEARTEREHYTPKPLKSSKDAMAVANAYAKTEPLATHPYLKTRGISDSVQQSAKFQGRFRIDSFKNVIFPHFIRNEVVGFEKKNNGFTGFSSGGEKGLWFSNNLKTASKVVIVESAIDAMSFDQLHGKGQNFGYISIGGQPNDEQIEALNQLKERLIIAVDNDEGGDLIASKIDPTGQIERLKPCSKDWNEELNTQLEQKKSQSQEMTM